MKNGNRSFAFWFYLGFSREIATKNNRSKSMYEGNRRKEDCRLFGRQNNIAWHRNYRHVLNLRRRCRRRKTAFRLNITTLLHYRRNKYRNILQLPPLSKSLPPKHDETSYRENVTAIWQYRPGRVRLKTVTEDYPGKNRDVDNRRF